MIIDIYIYSVQHLRSKIFFQLPGVVVGISGTFLLHNASEQTHSKTVMFPLSHLYSWQPSRLDPLTSHPLLHVIDPASSDVSVILI